MGAQIGEAMRSLNCQCCGEVETEDEITVCVEHRGSARGYNTVSGRSIRKGSGSTGQSWDQSPFEAEKQNTVTLQMLLAKDIGNPHAKLIGENAEDLV